MTNSKLYCNKCGERWRPDHDPCRSKTDPVFLRIHLNEKTISIGYLCEDESVRELFPEFYDTYLTIDEWKKKHMIEGALFHK
jgi:hypothetical protein